MSRRNSIRPPPFCTWISLRLGSRAARILYGAPNRWPGPVSRNGAFDANRHEPESKHRVAAVFGRAADRRDQDAQKVSPADPLRHVVGALACAKLNDANIGETVSTKWILAHDLRDLISAL